MIFLYFIYGLAFFSLGISLLIYPKKYSEFRLAHTLWLIALFGIFHGVHEWLQMFLLLQNLPDGVSLYLKTARLIILPVSFFFLFMFGIESIYQNRGAYSMVRTLPAILFITWAVLAAASRWNWVHADIWARYLLGVPGIFLSSYALIIQSAEFKIKMPSIAVTMNVGAGIFLTYGICAGLIVPESNFFPASWINDKVFIHKTGIPIQLVRTLCALVLSYSMIKILYIFNFETKEKLRILSLKDELTGLLNRRGFVTLAEQQLKLAKRLNKKVVLHLSDMDNLKLINDTLGHNKGDLAIIEMAGIIKETFRQSDIIARIGGDEFVMLQLDEIDSNPNIVATRLQNNLDLFNLKEKRKYKISISLGTFMCGPEVQPSIAELLEEADKAMYVNKRSKRKFQTD
jgi:diguanylate cyclase (GGDEF)-like protein